MKKTVKAWAVRHDFGAGPRYAGALVCEDGKYLIGITEGDVGAYPDRETIIPITITYDNGKREKEGR